MDTESNSSMINETGSVICLTDENSSDSEVAVPRNGHVMVEQMLSTQRDEFLLTYQSVLDDLERSKHEWTQIEEEISALKLEYTNKLKRLYRRQRKLKKKLSSYKKPRRDNNPLKVAYETKFKCPICLEHQSGEYIFHMQCSHLLCKYCFQLSTKLECPICRAAVENIHYFVKNGERYSIKSINKEGLIEAFL